MFEGSCGEKHGAVLSLQRVSERTSGRKVLGVNTGRRQNTTTRFIEELARELASFHEQMIRWSCLHQEKGKDYNVQSLSTQTEN